MAYDMSRVAMLRRLHELEAAQAKQKAATYIKPRPSFRVCPSCPPDKSIQVRGGWMGYTPGSAISPGDMWYVEPQTINFADSDFDGFTTFDTANYYQLVIICLQEGQRLAAHGINFYYDDTEYATAGEAEATLDALLTDQKPWSNDYPLIVLVLRNNGVTATAAAIMPITAVNRGGSYIFQDMRPPADFVG